MDKKILAAVAAIVMMTAVPCGAENADAEKPAAPSLQTVSETAETVSAVGSVSKVFCTVCALQLSEQGLLDIDAPVTDYVPEFTMQDERYKDITVRMLMNHSSGLEGNVFGDMIVYDEATTEYHDTFLEKLSRTRLKADPGTMSSYCNDGFTLLEIVVERVSGQSFTDYVDEHIAKPLALENTGTSLKMYGNEKAAKVLVDGDVRYATDYCTAFGSGGIMSTAPELARFGSAMFTGNDVLLSQASKDEMEKNTARDKYEDGFGLGWDKVDCSKKYDMSKDVQLEFKGGSLNHQLAGLMVAPDEKISVSVLLSGGDSNVAIAMSESLMLAALEEQGITSDFIQPEARQTVDTVPDEYLAKADIYARESGLYSVSFPDGRFMEITELTSVVPLTKRYMYTTDGDFVLMNGEPGTSTFSQDADQHILEFVERDGETYICDSSNTDFDGFGRDKQDQYFLQRVGKYSVSDDVQTAWDARDGQRYYFTSASYSNMMYYSFRAASPSMLITVPDEDGYALIHNSIVKIADPDHGKGFVRIPGTAGRDVKDYEFFTEDGCEYVRTSAHDFTGIRESDIPAFSSDIHEIALETGRAKWYNIGEMANKSITLTIPDHASVYVYDRFDHTVYSSYMPDYGNTVSLPTDGKIVFVGETGGVVSIQ